LGNRQGGFKGIFDLQTGGFSNDHERAESGLNLLGGFVEFVKRLGGDSDVEGELEEAFGAFSKLSLEFFSVFKLDLSGRVGNAAAFNI